MRDEGVLDGVRYRRPGSARWFSSPIDAESIRAIFGVVFCILLLVAIFPLLTLIAVAIYAQDGGPVLFSHTRIGRHGRPFRCLKFRTMAVDAEQRLAAHLACEPEALNEWRMDHKLRDDPRITPIGAYLRRSSLDELPQILNVLRGEMNLVGPRPIVSDEIHRYGGRFKFYCQVKPGITGLWQVNGRNDVSYRRRVAMDTIYAKSRSLGGDLKILAMTLPAVLLRRGSY